MSPSLHCLTRTLLQADQIIRELRAAAVIDGISLITSARCACAKPVGLGPVGSFLAKSGIDEMAALDLPGAGRCVVGGNLLPILFSLANSSKHASVSEGLRDLGLPAANADHCAAQIADGWTFLHLPTPTARILARAEPIFTNAGAASITCLGAHLHDARSLESAAARVRPAAHAPAAWVSVVRSPTVTVPTPAGPAVLAESSWQ